MDRIRQAGTIEDKKIILERFLKLWETLPDLRFGQLIWNAFEGKDFFYVADDTFVQMLEDYYKKG